MTTLQTERMSGAGPDQHRPAAQKQTSMRFMARTRRGASVRISRLLVGAEETDSGLDSLMALPETAELNYGKQQDSHRNWRLPRHRSSLVQAFLGRGYNV